MFQDFGAFQVALVVKNPPANAGNTRDLGLIPGLGRSIGGGHGNSHQYSCLENLRNRGPCGATVIKEVKMRIVTEVMLIKGSLLVQW